MRRGMRRRGARHPAGNNPKAPEPIGYCSYCGTALYQPWQFHWMYDEDGQRVRKCKWMRRCCERRRQIPGQEESYRRAVLRYGKDGKERWLEGFAEEREDEDK